ncbi:hypothetical protein [Winogradskyella sp. PG-2]|uniref:hypothetical protein n=1 Tax=Winogradskyella sp. PG-2 TaxID=754409 RepID=UPI0004587777|nr:hypothetical protein [Winogradskyella sp. PG-2]BAO76334.1 hypothetical protein WPG_2104 [Winogradskyella sp. PG-2]
MRSFLIAFILLSFISCNNDDDSDARSQCDFEIIIDLDQYEIPSPSVYTIIDAQINENCLEITIGASGCDGESWDVELVSDFPLVAGDSGGSNLSLKLRNSEVCAAYFTRTFSFDTTELLGDLTSMSFVLEGWGGMLEVSN